MTATASAPLDANPLPAQPFLGLVPYSESERAMFFGRERDTRLLVDNVIAFDVTLLYGPSGVGKSSIVAAGVVPALRRRASAGESDLAAQSDRILPVTLRSWREDPTRRLCDAMWEAAWSQGCRVAPLTADAPLWRQIAHWTDACDADLCLVLDQFEEFFLYHDEAHDPFARELAEAIARPDVPAHFLFSIREDALATLDRLQERIPNLFENIYRLDPLHRDEARRAIVGPIEHYNRQAPPGRRIAIEPTLVEAVLDQTQAGRVHIGAPEDCWVEGADDRDEIEAAHLQLVMDRVWKAEAVAGSPVLRFETLRRLGGAGTIVRSHLDRSMADLSEHDRDLAARVFGQLVTPSGTKIAHRIDDLADYANVATTELSPVLEHLADGETRVLRPLDPPIDQPDAVRYEIFHDALGPAVLHWRARRQIAAAREAARRERRRWIALALVALLLVGLLGATIVQSVRSQQAASRARSEQLASQAVAQLDNDPTTAARTALAAWDESHTASAERALRLVAPQLHVVQGLSGHRGAVLDVEFSPDGARIVTASDDQTARLWDSATGAAVATLSGDTGPVEGATYDAAGRTILTWSLDGTARLWDGSSGAAGAVLDAGSGPIVDAALSPDGARAATVAEGSTAVALWDVATGAQVSAPLTTDDVVTAIAFAPDSGSLVTGDQSGDVRVWSAANGEPLTGKLATAVDGETPTFTDVAFNGNGDQVAIGTETGVLIWRWQQRLRTEVNPARLGRPGDGANQPRQIQFTADGSAVIAVSDKDGVVFPVPAGDAWGDPEAREPMVLLQGHKDWAFDIAASPTGDEVVTASSDGSAMVRDGRTGALLEELRGHRGGLNAVDIATDGTIATASSDGTVRLWEPPRTTVFHGHDYWVTQAVATPDQTELFSASPDGTVRRWDIAARTEVGQLRDGDPGSLGWLQALAVSDDGRHVAAGNADGIVRVWDVAQPDAPVATRVSSSSIGNLDFGPDDTLAVGSDDGGLIWDWRTDDLLTPLPTAGDWSVVAWSPTEDLVATGAGDGMVQLWDVGSGAAVASLAGHLDVVTGIGFDRDGRTLVSSSRDGTLRVWDVGSRRLVRVLQGQHGAMTSVGLRAGGRQAVTGSSDGTVAVWDLVRGQQVALLQTHDDYVNAVALLDDGRVLSAGDDDIVRLDACDVCRSVTDVVNDFRARLERLPAPASRDAGPIGVVELTPGVCLPQGDDSDLFSVEPVSCARPHADEVIGNIVLADEVDPAVPRPADLADRAADACVDRYFQDYVGVAYDDSRYVVTAFTPTEPAWELGNRRAVCILSDPAGASTGSARDSRE